MTGPATGSSIVTPAANAAADAECPLGKDDVQGRWPIRRAIDVRSGSGRRRPISGLITTLDTKLAAASEPMPRSDARLVRLPARKPTAASPIHNRPWSAVLVSSRSARSTGWATGTAAGTVRGSGGSLVTRTNRTLRPASLRGANHGGHGDRGWRGTR